MATCNRRGPQQGTCECGEEPCDCRDLYDDIVANIQGTQIAGLANSPVDLSPLNGLYVPAPQTDPKTRCDNVQVYTLNPPTPVEGTYLATTNDGTHNWDWYYVASGICPQNPSGVRMQVDWAGSCISQSKWTFGFLITYNIQARNQTTFQTANCCAFVSGIRQTNTIAGMLGALTLTNGVCANNVPPAPVPIPLIGGVTAVVI